MTLMEARRVADLLVTLDHAREWRESFEDSKAKFVGFEDGVGADNVRFNGERDGWEGPIGMERELAIEWMRWLEERVMAELKKFGVD